MKLFKCPRCGKIPKLQVKEGDAGLMVYYGCSCREARAFPLHDPKETEYAVIPEMRAASMSERRAAIAWNCTTGEVLRPATSKGAKMN